MRRADGTLALRRVAAVISVALLFLAASGGPAPAGTTSGEPVVVESDAVRTYTHDPSGVAVDRWVVWKCALDPGGPYPERVAFTPADAVEVLEREIVPYYEWLSEGAYLPVFEAGGTVASGPGQDTDLCLSSALAAAGSAGFAGAVIIADGPLPGASAQSGHQDCMSPPCVEFDTLPGNQRYLQLGAQDLFATGLFGGADYSETTHELGHSLDWGHGGSPPMFQAQQVLTSGFVSIDPHAAWIDELYPGFVTVFDSFMSILGAVTLEEAQAALGPAPITCNPFPSGPDPAATICFLSLVLDYGDVTDVMGTTPSPLSLDPSAIPQTQVFNRYAAGWLAPEDVAVHGAVGAEYRLAPIDIDGVQMLVLPSTDDERYVTLEARADSEFLPAGDLRPGARQTGVLVHLVDQRTETCGMTLCWGDVSWKTMMVEGTPWTFGSVLEPGTTTTIEGVSVEVVSLNDDGTYTVRVGDLPLDDLPATGAPVAPVRVATPVVRSPSFTG